MLADVLGVLWWLFHFVLGLLFWQCCFNCFKPSYVALEDMEHHHMGEQLLRVVTFCHACMCTVFLCAYFANLISPNVMILGRIYSTAFFVFDAIQVLQIYNRLRYLHLEDQIKNPLITLFHHGVTILLMHGFMFQGGNAISHPPLPPVPQWILQANGMVLPGTPVLSPLPVVSSSPQLTGLVLFYLAEIAMLPVLITWRYIHVNQEASLACAICRIVEILLYGGLRVLLIPPLFLAGFLPHFEHERWLAWPMLLCYLLVYVMNVIWFVQMATGTSESLLQFAQDLYGSSFQRNLNKIKSEWCQSLKS